MPILWNDNDNIRFGLIDSKYDFRYGLLDYLTNSSNYGTFKARIESKDDKKKRTLLKNIILYFDSVEGDRVYHNIDHVWVEDTYLYEHIDISDYVEFEADVYCYERANGTSDFSLDKINNVEIISEYSYPSEKDSIQEFIDTVICKVSCPYNIQCQRHDFVYCLHPQWKKNMREILENYKEEILKEFATNQPEEYDEKKS